ncbi:coatomer subunit epsilon-1-like [Chenopodium quinoa]|uniref:coatomer subunit epsilon-1-like n=1 Tax=Chenopodium quinoa TaxID=63459 RepID=UPI000B77F219|nr:coatomer subunit epsilon-1-like [Chenopodium quinoa]
MKTTDKGLIMKVITHVGSFPLIPMKGGSKIQEAYLIFQDFSEKYSMTGLILNGKAVCCMHMGNFDEAESLLLEALNKVNYLNYLQDCGY